jgi:hypothetical protein
MTWWAEGDWPEHGYWVKVVLLRNNPEGAVRQESGIGGLQASKRLTSRTAPQSQTVLIGKTAIGRLGGICLQSRLENGANRSTTVLFGTHDLRV